MLIQCYEYEYINVRATSNTEISDRNLPNIVNKQVLSLHITYLVLDNDNNLPLLFFCASCHNFRLPKSIRTEKREREKQPNTHIELSKFVWVHFSVTRLVNKFVFTFFVYACYLNSLWSSWARKSDRWGPIRCSKWIPLAGKFFFVAAELFTYLHTVVIFP